MPPVDLIPRSSSPFTDMIETNVESASPISEVATLERRTKWQERIDLLLEYYRDPGQLADDGIDPPAHAVLAIALRLANDMKNKSLAAPDRIVCDGDGGVVFERNVNDVTEAIHIWDDRTVDYQLFHGSRLVQRANM